VDTLALCEPSVNEGYMTAIDPQLLLEKVNRILNQANSENRDLSDLEETRVQTLMDFLDACTPVSKSHTADSRTAA